MKSKLILLSLLFGTSVVSAKSINHLSDEQKSAVDQIFTEWEQSGSPGASLGVFKNGEVIYAKGYGSANLEYDIPNSPQSVFRIGSTSKQFTAAAIVLLAEQEKLNLDDSINKFFPDFPDYSKKITVRHLLNHTSGIRDYLTLTSLKGFGNDDHYIDSDVMSMLVKQRELNFAPGEEHLYSNSGYWLLGQIVNKVSGMNMADFAKQEIFTPLGMANTHFHNNHNTIVKNRASGYRPLEDGGYEISMTTLDMIGDGGIFTTIDDAKKWDDAFYNSKVLSKEFWSMMLHQGTLNNGEELSYASGLIVGKHNGLKTISHGGSFVGFRADMIRYPEQKFSVALFANRADANPSAKAKAVAEVLLKDEMVTHTQQANTLEESSPTEDAKIEELGLDALVGTYSLQPGVDFEVSAVEQVLYVKQHWNGKEYPIIKTSGNTFHIKDAPNITFTFSDVNNGKAQVSTVFQNGRNTPSKRKVEVNTEDVNLPDYEGHFYSEELDIVYSLHVSEGQLFAKIADGEEFQLNLSTKDVFNYRGVLMNFAREDKTVSEFTLDAGRVKNILFSKVK